MLHSLGRSNSLMKLFAFDRNASGNYATNVPAGEAMHITYTQDILGQAVSTSQYVLFDGDRGYVLTFAALPEHEAGYADTFERSARSFRPG